MKTHKKVLSSLLCVLPLIFAAACSGSAGTESYSSSQTVSAAETDVSQTAEPVSSASEEYEMFSVEHLKSTEYYQKVMDWFDEKNFFRRGTAKAAERPGIYQGRDARQLLELGRVDAKPMTHLFGKISRILR